MLLGAVSTSAILAYAKHYPAPANKLCRISGTFVGIFERNAQVQHVSYVMSQLYWRVARRQLFVLHFPAHTHLRTRGHVATRADLGFVPSTIYQMECVWSAASLQARTSNPDMGSETAWPATLDCACSLTCYPTTSGKQHLTNSKEAISHTLPFDFSKLACGWT